MLVLCAAMIRVFYRICFLGMLDASWSAMLGNMKLTTERIEDRPCVTTLSGLVTDQAALMGVLNLAYDLGLVLLLVEREKSIAERRIERLTAGLVVKIPHRLCHDDRLPAIVDVQLAKQLDRVLPDCFG